jgi:hypothetical protein
LIVRARASISRFVTISHFPIVRNYEQSFPNTYVMLTVAFEGVKGRLGPLGRWREWANARADAGVPHPGR